MSYKKKIYLINPPAFEGVKMVREGRCMQRKGAWTSVWPPISLALCGAVLEKEGYTVKLSDCIVEDIDLFLLKEKIKEFNPDLVVINTATPSIIGDIEVAKDVKEINPKALVTAIGIHVTALPNECLTMATELDCVIRGEPEMTVLDLVNHLDENWEQIDGISWKNNEKIFHNKDRELISLDELPIPAWHLINLKNYLMPFTLKPFLLVATGRGCPHPCNYCADHVYYGKKLRIPSPEKVVNELAYVKEKYGIDEFLFWSEAFTLNRKFAKEVAKGIIEKKLNIKWVCNSRVDNVDYELLKLLKQAGCTMVGYGIESGSQEILDNCKKGITLEQIKKAVEETRKAGLDVTGHCIIGLPGETKETIENTVKFTLDLKLDFVQYYCAVPFPGSQLYKQALKEGWINTSDWKKYEQNFSVLDFPGLSAEEIMKLRKKAYKTFYSNPYVVIKTLKRMKSPSEWKNFIRMAVEFVEWCFKSS